MFFYLSPFGLIVLKAINSQGHCTRSPKFSHVKKINKTSRCANHVYTLLPKRSFVIKKFVSGSIFASVTSILIGKDDEYEKKKTHFDV